jgi:hypothetical protein
MMLYSFLSSYSAVIFHKSHNSKKQQAEIIALKVLSLKLKFDLFASIKLICNKTDGTTDLNESRNYLILANENSFRI